MPLKASSGSSRPLCLPSLEFSVSSFGLWPHVPYVIVFLFSLSDFPSINKTSLYAIQLCLCTAPSHHSPFITPQFKLCVLLRLVLSPPRAPSMLSPIYACHVFLTQVSPDFLRSNTASWTLFLTSASLQSPADLSESSGH